MSTARYATPVVPKTTGAKLGVTVRESIGGSVGDEMVAVGGAITKGKLLTAGRVEGTKVVGRIVGERVGEPEGRDEGLSEGHNERY